MAVSDDGASRREVLAGALAFGAATLASGRGWADASGTAAFAERTVLREGHRLYVRDYPGGGPAFVMLHGFPDNCRIYEEVAGRLSTAGRRVVAFDFLGFGRSDKPEGVRHGFAQQLADVQAVVDGLDLGTVIPVGHDAGGPAAVNFALDNEPRVAGLVLMNSYYANSPVLRFPEFIELCCNPKTQRLARALMTDPGQAAWLFGFQQDLLRADLPLSVRERFDAVMQPLIAENFSQSPSAMPAFLDMTADAYPNLAANDLRLPELGAFGKPVTLVWGVDDLYLSKAVADDIARHCADATLTVLAANHWPQFDQPDAVAEALLAIPPK